jgi:thiamine pyrophosphokinase
VKAFIFVNGELADPVAVAQSLTAGALLIAADGGARLLDRLGRLPHLLIGDLDSVDPALVASYEALGVPIERHAVNKDQTDLELALEAALARQADEVVIVGALGGRLDHALANVLILAQRDWPVRLWIHDGRQQATLLRGPADFLLQSRPGRVVSMIPLSERVTGISYEGFEYPLTHATLELGSTRGVSNRLLSANARIQVENGLLLLVLQPEDGPLLPDVAQTHHEPAT